jgi:alpha/beta superfamily hydrolase
MNNKLLYILISIIFFGFCFEATGQGKLPRRAFIGLDMEPLSIETKKQLGMEQTIYGVYVKGTIDGSPAQTGGLKRGDVIEYLDETKINSPQDILVAIRKIDNTSTITFGIYRKLKPKKVKVTLIPFPKEESAFFNTIYTSVVSGTNTHRVLITRPKAEGNYPAVILLQGVGCFTQDNMNYPAVRNIVDSLTMAGFVVMRVEKSGVGDSQGKPCKEINFEEAVGGYGAGLRLLMQQSYVDTSNVFAIGFDIGGIIAPILNMQIPLKGIVSYGSIGKNWFEYEIENSRRQFMLTHQSLDSLDNFMRKEYNRIYGLFVSMATPTAIIEKYPWTKDNLFIYPMSFEYFQQIALVDISSLWLRTNTHVLAIYGTADFVSSVGNNKNIANLVNAKSPGMGTYLELEGIDHWLNKAKDERASLTNRQSEFNPVIIQTIKKWLIKISGS